MKQFLLLCTSILFFQSAIFAQKIGLETIEIKFTQLPLVPVPNGTMTYDVEYKNAHEEEVNAAENSYVEDKEAAQDEVDSEQQAVKIINAIGGNSTKARVVEKPYLPIVYTESNVLQKFTLNELSRSESPDVKLQINFNGFNYTKSQMTTTKSDVKYYYYSVKAKHEMSVSLTDNTGNIIHEFDIPDSNKIKTSSTKSFSSRSALDAYWANSKHNVLRPLERRITDYNIKVAQREITNQFGISDQTKKVKVVFLVIKKRIIANTQRLMSSFVKGLCFITMTTKTRKLL